MGNDMIDVNSMELINFIGDASDSPSLAVFLDRLCIYDLPLTPEEDKSFTEYPAMAYSNSKNSK